MLCSGVFDEKLSVVVRSEGGEIAATLELEVYYSQACSKGGGNHANQPTYIHTQDRRKV